MNFRLLGIWLSLLLGMVDGCCAMEKNYESVSQVNEAYFRCPLCKASLSEQAFEKHIVDMHKVNTIHCLLCKASGGIQGFALHMKLHKEKQSVAQTNDKQEIPAKRQRVIDLENSMAESRLATVANLGTPPTPPLFTPTPIPIEVVDLLLGSIEDVLEKIPTVENDNNIALQNNIDIGDAPINIDLESAEISVSTSLIDKPTVINQMLTAKTTFVAPSLYNCEYCEESFFLAKERNEHVKSAHPGHSWKKNKHNPDKRFFCKECPKSFKMHSGLSSHIATIHKRLRYKCDTCGVWYSGKDSLKSHIITKHPDSSIENYSIVRI